MARILAVGIATLDIINRVAEYPAENAEVRAAAQSLRRGGNATNTLAVLSQLGHQGVWAGTLADDANSKWITEDLAAHGIDCVPVRVVPGGRAPTSYVTLSERNGSRSIVHYRDLPEYDAADFDRLDLGGFDWLHFEGRNVAQTRRMLARAAVQAPRIPRSLEIEKPRDDIDTLLPLATVLLYSRPYAEHTGFSVARGGAAALLEAMARRHPHALHVCTWGEAGVWALPGGASAQNLHHSPAFAPTRVVDTLGAGDAFNAGFIDARLRGLDLAASLAAACRLAGRKCGQHGLAGLVE